MFRAAQLHSDYRSLLSSSTFSIDVFVTVNRKTELKGQKETNGKGQKSRQKKIGQRDLFIIIALGVTSFHFQTVLKKLANASLFYTPVLNFLMA